MSKSQLKKSTKKAAAPKRSKDELEYNRLTRKIAKAKNLKESQVKKMDELLIWINEFVQPEMVNWHDIKLAISECLLGAIPSFTDDEEKKSVIIKYVGQILDEVEYSPVMISEELRKRIDGLRSVIEKYSKEGLEKLPPNEREAADDLIRDSFNEMLEELRVGLAFRGIEIDFSDLHHEMSRAEIDAILKERIKTAAEKSSKSHSDFGGNRFVKKSVKDETKNMGISQLYKKLVKWIHPDLELDADQKLIKENWMKTLTVAYEKNDLTSMLKLETEVVRTLDLPSEKISPDKLKSYNRLLKKLLAETEAEAFHVMMAPKYRPVHFYLEPFGGVDFADFNRGELLSDLNDRIKEDKKLLTTLTKSEKSRNKKMTAICNELIAEMDDEFMMDDLNDIFGF